MREEVSKEVAEVKGKDLTGYCKTGEFRSELMGAPSVQIHFLISQCLSHFPH